LGRLFIVSANLSMEGRTSDFAPMSIENQVQVQNAESSHVTYFLGQYRRKTPLQRWPVESFNSHIWLSF
jgi:hypothetical protein